MGRRHVYRGQSTAFFEVVGDLAVVYGFVHAYIEKLLACLWIIDREHYCGCKILDMNEVALNRFSGGVEHNWNGLGSLMSHGVFWRN